MIFCFEIGFRNNICGSTVPFRRARQVLKRLLEQHAVLKVLAERMPVKMWVPLLALQRALGRADILPWIVSTNSAVVCARNAFNIRTTFVGNEHNAENRCVVFCGPDCADTVDEARIINNAELLAAALTTDDSKYTRVQRWLERTHTAVAARPAASTKRARTSHGAAAAASPGGAAAAASPSRHLTRGAPFSSARRRHVAVEGRSRDDLQRDLESTRRRLEDTDLQTPRGDVATRLRVAEERYVAAEANAEDAATRAAVAEAREARCERLTRVFERATLRTSRDCAAREVSHNRALKIFALGARVTLERGKLELQQALDELACCRAPSRCIS